MLTGDNRRTGEAIAAALGIEARAELLPDGKVAEIRRLAADHRVMMVGDGINDAPALAAAQIGVAMGSGTDVALETADAALMRSRVTDAARLIRLARATMDNIRANIAIALGLKAVFLVTSLTGYTGLWLAILADTGATVLVTLNALRLLAFNPSGRADGRCALAAPASLMKVEAGGQGWRALRDSNPCFPPVKGRRPRPLDEGRGHVGAGGRDASGGIVPCWQRRKRGRRPQDGKIHRGEEAGQRATSRMRASARSPPPQRSTVSVAARWTNSPRAPSKACPSG